MTAASSSNRAVGRCLLFLGDVTEPGFAKTAYGLRDWAGERCVGELRLPGATVSTGLPALTCEQAVAQGASKQYRQRSASTRACVRVSRGAASAKWWAYCSAARRAGRTSGAWESVAGMAADTHGSCGTRRGGGLGSPGI